MISKDDKALIKQFVSNKPLMEVVRRMMVSKIYEQGGVENSTTNFVFGLDMSKLDDAAYGQKVKVIVQAMLELETAFKEMVAEVAEPAKPVSTDNQAR
jgi:hypothetical protein